MSSEWRTMRSTKIIAIHILNFLDALLTLCVVSVFGVEEANPVLTWALRYSPTTLLVIKFTTVTFALVYLEKNVSVRREWIFDCILVILLSVFCWHAYGMLMLNIIHPTPGM